MATPQVEAPQLEAPQQAPQLEAPQLEARQLEAPQLDGAAVGTGAPQLEAPGTQFATRAAFEAAGWKIVKQSPSAVEHVMLVLARKGDGDGLWHLFFENTTDSNIKIPGGTWVGKGGPGSFVATTDIPSAKDAYKWHFTRLTDYKKDIAKYANANIVLSVGDGEGPAVPVMVTPAQAEEVLGTSALGEGGVVKVYGHATTMGRPLGQARALRQAARRVGAHHGGVCRRRELRGDKCRPVAAEQGRPGR